MLPIVLSFTGRSDGMNEYQMDLVYQLCGFSFPVWGYKIVEAHHGDCIGADAQFHDIISAFTDNIVIHPALNPQYRAFCHANTILPPKKALDRDDDMARICDIMLATPPTDEEILRSGTWATIRYAKKHKKKIYIVQPKGEWYYISA